MFQYSSDGIGNVGSYLISGYPFLTGGFIDATTALSGQVNITFPRVTKAFTIVNKGSVPLMVHFDSKVNTNVINCHHYVTLNNQDDSYGFGLRCVNVYISALGDSGIGSFELYAELTNIDSREMHSLSGSGINSNY